MEFTAVDVAASGSHSGSGPASPARRVLVVDDDPTVQDLVGEALRRGGFEVESDLRGIDVARRIGERRPDLIVLDVNLPGVSGLDLLREIRTTVQTPIPVIMLTAEAGEADRVVGLELGADDYVAKPFSPRELLARVRSLLRRSAAVSAAAAAVAAPAAAPVTVSSGKLTLDSARHAVTFDGQPVQLTATEFRILETLVRHAGEVLSRAAIHQAVHQTPAYDDDRAIDAHVKTIRRKLDRGATMIETIRGVGYRVITPAPSEPESASGS